MLFRSPTLPSTISVERAINPFLRTTSAPLIQSVLSQDPQARSEVEVFAALREWKNRFR